MWPLKTAVSYAAERVVHGFFVGIGIVSAGAFCHYTVAAIRGIRIDYRAIKEAAEKNPQAVINWRKS